MKTLLVHYVAVAATAAVPRPRKHQAGTATVMIETSTYYDFRHRRPPARSETGYIDNLA